MHEGAVSAELGLHGWPAIAESDHGRPRPRHRPPRGRGRCTSATCRWPTRSPRSGGPASSGSQVSAEVTPHHLCLTDEAVRGLDPATSKMNPPLRIGLRSGRADRRAGRRHARLHRHRSRTPPRSREGRPVRGGAVRGHRPRDGLCGGLHPPRRAGPAAAADGDRAHVVRPGGCVRAAGADPGRRPAGRRGGLGSGGDPAGGAAVRLAIRATAPSPGRRCAASAA